MTSKIVLLYIVVMTILLVLTFLVGKARINKLRRSENITIGMDEEEMLSIMGGRYTKSLLKDNRVKYEWRLNASSYGTSHNGISTRTYSGVKKVTIYVKNGCVEEVRGLNLY